MRAECSYTIYDEILEWKENRSDKYVLLIKGVRSVGKSTIAEDFANSNYKNLKNYVVAINKLNIEYYIDKSY